MPQLNIFVSSSFFFHFLCVCSVRSRSAWNPEINKIIGKDYRRNKTMRINCVYTRKYEEIKEQFSAIIIIIGATWKDSVSNGLALCGHVCQLMSGGSVQKKKMEVAKCVHKNGSTIQINTQRQKQSHEQVKCEWVNVNVNVCEVNEWMRAAVVHTHIIF